MTKAVAYHRPSSIDEAVALLREPGRVVLAGGTVVNDRTVGVTRDSDDEETVEVVDIQALGLDGMEMEGPLLRIGAATTLQAMVDNSLVPTLLRHLARAELPSTLRNTATLGGLCAVGDGGSPLLAGLLVHGTEATTAGPNGELITSFTIAVDGAGAWSGTGRTPADSPIVAAVARQDAAGEVHLALTGVSRRPVVVDPTDPVAGLDPPADFRGSAEYRIELARIHTSRVLAELGAGG